MPVEGSGDHRRRGMPRSHPFTGKYSAQDKRIGIHGVSKREKQLNDIPEVREGDIVTLFGYDGEAFLPVDELAGYNHTISYELVCLLSKRVPRIYFRNGEAVAELDYLCSSK